MGAVTDHAPRDRSTRSSSLCPTRRPAGVGPTRDRLALTQPLPAAPRADETSRWDATAERLGQAVGEDLATVLERLLPRVVRRTLDEADRRLLAAL